MKGAGPPSPLSRTQGQLTQDPKIQVSPKSLQAWSDKASAPAYFSRRGVGTSLYSRTLQVSIGNRGMDIQTDLSYRRATYTHMGLCSSPDPDITVALGDIQATHLCPLLITFISLGLPLCKGYKPLCLSLYHVPPYVRSMKWCLTARQPNGAVPYFFLAFHGWPL